MERELNILLEIKRRKKNEMKYVPDWLFYLGIFVMGILIAINVYLVIIY